MSDPARSGILEMHQSTRQSFVDTLCSCSPRGRFIPPSTVVPQSRCILFSETQCALQIGAFRGGDLHFLPPQNETCGEASCPSGDVECYGPSDCSGDLCVRPPNITHQTRCFGFDDASFSLAECRFGLCTPRCPAGTTLESTVPSAPGSITAVGDLADQWCVAYTVCGCDEYEISGPSSTVDRVCRQATPPCHTTVPVLTQFEITPLITTADRACFAATPCGSVGVEFESVLLTPTTDRQCSFTTPCLELDGLYELVSPSATSDAVCANLTECIDLGQPGEQYEVASPTFTTDRVCADVLQCNTTDFASSVPTTSSDRACSPLTVCPSGSFGTFNGPMGAIDRDCAQCTRRCSPQMNGELVLLVDESGAVEYPWHGGASGNFALERAFFTQVLQGVASAEVAQSSLRISVVSYSSTADVDLSLAQSTTIAAVESSLNGLVYAGLGFNLTAALQTARTELLQARPSVAQTIVMVVSGSSGVVTDTYLATEVTRWESLAVGRDLTIRIVLIDGAVASGTAAVPAQLVRLTNMPRPTDPLAAESSLTVIPSFVNLTDVATTVDLVSGVCIPGCPTNTFQSSNCTAETNIVCQPVTPPCALDEYESQSVSQFLDRICNSWTTCGLDQFVVTAATPTANVVCADRSPSCLIGTFTAVAGTATSDRVCAPQLPPCSFPSFFESAAPSATSARVCTAVAQCAVTGIEWETAAPGLTSNRVCMPVSDCADEHFLTANATATADTQCQQCIPTFACTSTEHASECTATADRRCVTNTACTSTEYETTAPSRTSDRGCATLSPTCLTGQYQAAPPTVSDDRVCRSITPCAASQFVVTGATLSSDTVCAEATVCALDTAFEAAPVTLTTTRVCTPIRNCHVATEYETTPPTATTDRVCASFTPCASDVLISVNATSTSDRTCTAAASCDLASNYLLRPAGAALNDRCPVASSLPACTPLSVCNGTSFQPVAPTATTDRTCQSVSICSDLNEVELVAPTATSDRVCGSSPLALDFFTAAVPLMSLSDERLASHTTIRSAQQCAILCLAATGCQSFAWSSQFSFCLLFSSTLVNSGSSQEHDLLYVFARRALLLLVYPRPFHLLTLQRISCSYQTRIAGGPAVVVTTSTAASSTLPTAVSAITSVAGFRAPINGTAGITGMLYDCTPTLGACLQECRSRADCVAVEFSATAEVCAVLTSHPAVSPMPSGDFMHYARDTVQLPTLTAVTDDLDLFGTAIKATAGSSAAAVLFDGTTG